MIHDDIYCTMDWNLFISNWALVVAAGIGVVLALVIIGNLITRTGWGQLRQNLHFLAKARKNEAKAMKAVEKAESIARQLDENAEQTKPRLLQEAKDALQDARALAKIANDKLMVAENHVRRIILDEYAPVRQEALRQKYLPDPARDKKPLSFG